MIGTKTLGAIYIQELKMVEQLPTVLRAKMTLFGEKRL